MTRQSHVPRRLMLVAGMMVAGVAMAPNALAAPPVNTAVPTISGTPRDGQILAASTGSWTNSPTAYQYQWQRCRADGADCLGITGATEKTYLLSNADVDHTVRVRVLAVNADGAAVARSAPTDRITASDAPANTSRPTISGDATVGEELAADPGTWSNSPASFAYQWQRCDVDVASCFDVVGATGKTYGVRFADVGFRLRVEVRATNPRGSGSALSGLTSVVVPSTPITNARPTLTIISIRFVGARVYARFRVCDDSASNLAIRQTDSRPGRASYTRRFSTLVPPHPCGAYTRSWVPAARFRGHGRYTVTLRVIDKSGRTSVPARRSFAR
jgi:hypothetical protein